MRDKNESKDKLALNENRKHDFKEEISVEQLKAALVHPSDVVWAKTLERRKKSPNK